MSITWLTLSLTFTLLFGGPPAVVECMDFGNLWSVFGSQQDPIYTPDWPSIDSRPIPEWFDQSKIGIFVHWGVYSVPAFADEWFWIRWNSWGCETCEEYMTQNYKPGFTYQEFAPQFTAEFYDPNEWVDLFERAGAKYVVLTSKHHEGYTLFPSKYSFSWNSVDVGPHRDLVGELAEAIRNSTSESPLRFGLYYSMYEWFNPLWIEDRDNDFATDEYVRLKAIPILRELVEKYQPEIVWPDGEWEAPSSYWQATQFLAWLFNDSPVKSTVVVNDRWGNETRGEHGGVWTGGDRLNPGYLLEKKWENCMTLDKQSWGYRGNAGIDDYLSPEELMTTLVETVSCGGNLLVNVGPTREGIIVPIQQERLLQMGEWLGINGEAIYSSVPWTSQNDTLTSDVWYTTSSDKSKVFALVTYWPGENVVLGSVDYSPTLRISMLGYSGQNLMFESADPDPGIVVYFPRPDETTSKWVWTLVIQGIN